MADFDRTVVTEVVTAFDSGGSIDQLSIGQSVNFTYGVGGIGFQSAASDAFPYQRGLAQILKTTVNNSTEPGDQSFDNFWLRSQTDWSNGAGTDFMEPITSEKIQRSFTSSYGVNVWNIGKLSLLHKMTLVKTLTLSMTTASHILPVGTGYYLAASGSLYMLNTSLAETVVTGITAGEKVMNLVYGNGMVYVATEAAVYQINVASTPTVASKKFTVPTSGSDTRVWFMKDRVVITSGGAIWDQAPPAALAANQVLTYSTGTALSPLYQAGTGITWVGAVGTPTGVLFAASGVNGSAIYRVGLDTTGTVPVLSYPSVISEFPGNESLQYLGVYLGAYLLIGTNLGVRVGTIDPGTSTVTYGPRIDSPVPTGGFFTYDRFAFYPCADAGQGRAGMVRIDLSEIDESARPAWACDERVPSGTAVTIDGMHIDSSGVITATSRDSGHVYLYRSASTYESGYLESSAVRLGTAEKKYFDSLKIQVVPPMDGSVTVTAIGDDDQTMTLGTITSSYDDNAELKVPSAKSFTHFRLGFTLSPSSNELWTPVLQSWQLRALPAVTRQRLIQVPILCFDHERDNRGVNFGHEGYAIDRWKSLETLISTGKPFIFQDFVTGESFRVVMESVSFSQAAPPAGFEGFGGVIELTLRSL